MSISQTNNAGPDPLSRGCLHRQVRTVLAMTEADGQQMAEFRVNACNPCTETDIGSGR